MVACPEACQCFLIDVTLFVFITRFVQPQFPLAAQFSRATGADGASCKGKPALAMMLGAD